MFMIHTLQLVSLTILADFLMFKLVEEDINSGQAYDDAWILKVDLKSEFCEGEQCHLSDKQ